jgi:hypothetical protein
LSSKALFIKILHLRDWAKLAARLRKIPSSLVSRLYQGPSRWNVEQEIGVNIGGNQLSRTYVSNLILLSWRWERHIRPKRLLTINELHGGIFQKTEHFWPPLWGTQVLSAFLAIRVCTVAV